MASFFNSYIFVATFLVAVLGFWGIGAFYSLHFIFWWYDAVAHFFGGAWVMSLAFFLKNKLKIEAQNLNGVVLFVAMIGAVALVGVLWEFFELILDRYIMHTGFTYFPRVFEDTLSDLLMDLLGGAFMFLIL